MRQSKLTVCVGLAPVIGMVLTLGCLPSGVDVTRADALPINALIVKGAPSALINALSEDYQLVDADLLRELVETEAGAGALALAKLFAVDASLYSAEEIAQDPVFQAARAAGLSILLDNSPDAAHVQALFGVGGAALDEATRQQLAELGVPSTDQDFTALVEHIDGDREYLISLYGPPQGFGLAGEVSTPEETEDVGMPDPADTDAETPENTPQYTGVPADAATGGETFLHYDLNDAARLIGVRERLREAGELPRGLKDAFAAQNSGDLNDLGDAKKTWWVNMPAVNWTPGDNQQVFTAVDFRVDLFASSVPHTKFLRVTAVGTGAAPGQMAHNDHRHLGWFQDQVLVQFGPRTGDNYGNSNVRIYQHSPPNANNVIDVSSTTGFSVGVGADSGGGSANYSYNESQTISTQITDFQVINDTDPDRAQWRYQLHQVGGGTYNFSNPSKTLPHRVKCHVEMHQPPTLARQTIQPNAQAVWRADGDFDGTVDYRFYVEHRVTKVDVTSEHCKFIHTVSWHAQAHWYTHHQYYNLGIDFSAAEPN